MGYWICSIMIYSTSTLKTGTSGNLNCKLSQVIGRIEYRQLGDNENRDPFLRFEAVYCWFITKTIYPVTLYVLIKRCFLFAFHFHSSVFSYQFIKRIHSGWTNILHRHLRDRRALDPIILPWIFVGPCYYTGLIPSWLSMNGIQKWQEVIRFFFLLYEPKPLMFGW